MKLLSTFTALIAGARAALDVVPHNFRVTKTRGTRLYLAWDSAGTGTVDEWNVIVSEVDTGKVTGNVSPDKRNPGAFLVDRLRAGTKYNIVLRAVGGGDEGPEASFMAWTSHRPVEDVATIARYESSVWIGWSPPDYRTNGQEAGQYVITNVDDDSERYFTSSTNLQLVLGTGVSRKYIIQSVACDDCEHPTNEAWSRPVPFEVTSIPPKPTNLHVVEENIRDLETADILLAWDHPNFEYDSVKVEYSPNSPQAQTKSPSFIPGTWDSDMIVEGLYQNTIYTINLRFVLNNVEGPSEAVSVAVADASSGEETYPKVQNCQVPTYLRPENLRVTRDIFGESAMKVTWEHPRAKKPENGYRLVFAPFTSVMEQKPWFENVDRDTSEFRLSGPKYDPYDEYTVSLVAVHDEQLSSPQSPDFIASTFTGTRVVNERNLEFIAPDSCCGNKKYNSKVQECCGGNLYDSEGNVDTHCCGVSLYSPSREKCCSNGVLVSNTQSC